MEEGKKEGGEPIDLALRTRRFALAIISLSRRIPRADDAGLVIRRQILRCGTSVGAQYREGRRARSSAEYVSKIQSALQELDETGYWLELLRDAKLVDRKLIGRFLKEVDELIRILVTCADSAKG